MSTPVENKLEEKDSEVEILSCPGRAFLLGAKCLTQPPLRVRGVVRAVQILAQALPSWRSVPTVGPDGQTVWLDFSDSDFAWVCGGWRTQPIMRVLRNVAPEAVALDIGANIGVMTRTIASSLPRGTVHAFEPSQKTFARLTKNCAAYPQITCHEFAIADRTATIAFSSAETSSPTRRITVPGEASNNVVSCWRLDEWCETKRLSRLDFIKVDVEGFEEEVLIPAETVLAKFHPTLFFEYTKAMSLRSTYRGRELFPFLLRLGYKVMRLDITGNEFPYDAPDRDGISNDYVARMVPR